MDPLLSLFLVGGLLFTFDDGPKIETTPIILDTLKKNGIKAIFCIPAGNLLDKKKLKIAKRILAEGHIMCNHSVYHPDFSKISITRQRWEIRQAQTLFEEKLGARPLYFRPPCGVRTKAMLSEVKSLGMSILMWDLDTKDWHWKTSEQNIVDKIARWSRGGRKPTIALLHDTNRKTAKILEIIIRSLDGK